MDNNKDNGRGGGQWTTTRMTTTTRAADDVKDEQQGLWTMMRRWVTIKIHNNQTRRMMMDDYKDNGRWTMRRAMGQQQGLWTPTRTTHKDRRQ